VVWYVFSVVICGDYMKEKIVVSWSGGKDSAYALFEIQQSEKYEIEALFTMITSEYDRISIHGVRRELLEQQRQALGLPLEKVFINKDVSNEEYEKELIKALSKYSDQGVSAIIFGDIALEDVRIFREELSAKVGLKALFPLWQKDTKELAESFINLGFKAVITMVSSNVLGKEYAGREYSKDFLQDIRDKSDLCGENGEFHSFVYDGPNFKNPIPFAKGEIVLRDNRFWYCDLLPK